MVEMHALQARTRADRSLHFHCSDRERCRARESEWIGGGRTMILCRMLRAVVLGPNKFIRRSGGVRTSAYMSLRGSATLGFTSTNKAEGGGFPSSRRSLNEASSPTTGDLKLLKAIVYESSKQLCNAEGNTSRFSDFLASQLSSYAEKSGISTDSKHHIVALTRDVKGYSQMSYDERLELLDRVAQLQGFSSTKDLVDHQIAIAEASENLHQDANIAELALPKTKSASSAAHKYAAITFGSSEPVELYSPTERPTSVTEVTEVTEVESACCGTAPIQLEDDKREKCRTEAIPPASADAISDTGTTEQTQPRLRKVLADWKLDTPLTELKCFTPLQQEQLQENGFFSVRSLLNHFPRAHINFDSPTATMENGQFVSLPGTIIGTRAAEIKNALALLEVTVQCKIGQNCLVCTTGADNEDTTVFLHIKRFFRGPRFVSSWFLNKLTSEYPQGSSVVVNGRVKVMTSRGHFEVKDYDLRVLKKDDGQPINDGKVYPVYPAKGTLEPKKIQQYIGRLLSGLTEHLDPLPEDLRKKHELFNLKEAYLGLHSPDSMEEANLARRRFVFDDFFYLQLAFLLRRHALLEDDGSKLLNLEDWSPLALQVVNSLPFKLTAGQIKAASEIMWDLRQAAPMSRLLQGDVGCGKTIVAFLALLDMASSGYQGALMAPTEFVASQHYAQFISWLEALDEKERPRIALLLGGSTSTSVARNIRERLSNKEIDIVIGTHALISDATKFDALGLAVIDEQHRFGVAQRDRLKAFYEDADGGVPEEGKPKVTSATHVLLMSATPIPRSLALTVHGDMSLSQITDIPPGRTPIETHVLPDNVAGRQRAYQMIKEELATGGRAFIIYPLIELSDNLSQRAATVEFDKICEEFNEYKCVLVHGRIRPDLRNQLMTKFRQGEYQLLVSTTVVEVGIDIPEASIILVENAETYGVAQLHQLRGRVGRGKRKSTCFLLSPCESAIPRLKLLESTTDGFCLAEADLKMRGPGDLMGKRQSGQHMEFVLAKLGDDSDILEQARAAAIELLRTNEKLNSLPTLKQEINIRQLPASWS